MLKIFWESYTYVEKIKDMTMIACPVTALMRVLEEQ